MDSPTIRYLQQRLQSCLAVEDYEQAARLRDRIKQLLDPEITPYPRPGPLALRPTAEAPSREELRRTRDLEDALRHSPRFFEPAMLETELLRMREHAREQEHRYIRQHKEAIETAIHQQMAYYFPGLVIQPHAMRGQGFILTDHRTNTDEYHFRGKLLLVVDRSVLPWQIIKI